MFLLHKYMRRVMSHIFSLKEGFLVLLILVGSVVVFACKFHDSTPTVFLNNENYRSIGTYIGEDIILSVDESSISASGLTFSIQNFTGHEICTSQKFFILQQKNAWINSWAELPWLNDEEPSWWATKICIGFSPGNQEDIEEISWTDSIAWDDIYGKLLPGKYLLLKQCDETYLFARFDII